MELSDGFATQIAIPSKRKADVPNVYHRYRYGSFAEYPEECIPGNRRGTSNKRVCGRDIEGQLRKESVWFRTKESFCPKPRSAKGSASQRSKLEPRYAIVNSRWLIISMDRINC